jgi:pimeloyl-ACP methyl ester carboxylesterase
MNDLAELKQFVVAQAISQNLPADQYDDVLNRITTDAGDEPGSWAHEWIRAGEEFAGRGALLPAAQYFATGRFPFVDGPGRGRALARCVETFEQWARDVPQIDSLTIEVDGKPVRLWTTALSADEPRPLLIMSGGIVSPKEQWAAVLPQLASFGLAAVVTELPGVGESPLRYDADSWRLFPAIMDALAPRAKVDQTYLLALSFSGHLALRAAGRDPRIRGVVGNGTPVRAFFTDRAWQRRVPKVTRDTLAHLVGVPEEQVFDAVRDWGLSDDELAGLDVPFAAVVAGRDEIIPPADADLLRVRVRDARLIVHDDVHGAPSHLAETKVWSLRAVLRMWPDAAAKDLAALDAAVRAARSGGATS